MHTALQNAKRDLHFGAMCASRGPFGPGRILSQGREAEGDRPGGQRVRLFRHLMKPAGLDGPGHGIEAAQQLPGKQRGAGSALLRRFRNRAATACRRVATISHWG